MIYVFKYFMGIRKVNLSMFIESHAKAIRAILICRIKDKVILM